MSKQIKLSELKLENVEEEEDYSPGCETGCSPGHNYKEEVCCFKYPGVTWEDYYRMIECEESSKSTK